MVNMIATNCIIVQTTIGSKKEAKELAQKILEEKLAACVQIQKIESSYWWKGEIECSDEYLLSIKTKTDLFYNLFEFIQKNHHYETPEIIQIPITYGSDAYLEWIESYTKQ